MIKKTSDLQNQLTQRDKFLAQFNYVTTDYHNFSGPDSTKEHCEKLNIGEWYINACECKRCGYYVRSRNRHDMVTCLCGATSVDGGSEYLRRAGDLHQMIERSVKFDWAKDMVG